MRKTTIAKKPKNISTMPGNKHRNQGNKNKEDIMTPPNEQDTPIQDYEDDEIEEMQEADLKKLIRTLRSSQKQILELQKSLMDKIENLSCENEILRRNQNEMKPLVEQETVIVTRNHNEVKNSIDQMTNTLESLKNRMSEAEERILDLEDRERVSTQSNQRKEEEIRNLKNIVGNLQDTIKKTNIRILGVPEGMEREKGLGGLVSEILAENFPGLEKDRDILVQEAHRTPNKHDQKRSSLRHIVIKLTTVKHKEKIIKCAKRNVRLLSEDLQLDSADFSSETLQARREWQDIAQELREENCQPRILYPAKLSFVNEGEIKTFHSKQKLKEFVTTNPVMQKILKNVLHTETQKHGHQYEGR
uniref:L1 transposable element RRM domain-containing protein n=1 Tax=Oryctolagus cuniculus TaxID=9986 RepID=A0A5F9CHS7_RABIT